MNAAVDTELVLSYAYTSILVVQKYWANINDLNRAIDIIEKGDTEFLGYVLNNFKRRKPLSTRKDGYRVYR